MGNFYVLNLLIIYLCMIIQIQCVDWCNIKQKYCKSFNTVREHIGCNPYHVPKGDCQNIKVIEIDEQLKKVIIDNHNEKRNLIASGQFHHFPSASHMREMSWDNELEDLAKLHVKNCRMQHDQCRATEKFNYAGQNLAMMGSTAGLSDRNVSVRQMILDWFNEYKDAPASLISKYESTQFVVGHFTVMMRQENSHVGCGLISYESRDRNNIFYNFMLTCDYADTNMLNQPIYDIGPPASKCTQFNMVKSDKFKNLCALPQQKPEIVTDKPTPVTTKPTIAKTTVHTNTHDTTKIPQFEVDDIDYFNPSNSNKLRVIFLDGRSVPINMRKSISDKGIEVVANCEMKINKNIRGYKTKLFISSKEQDYEYYIHNKLKIWSQHISAPINLNYKLNQETISHNFAIHMKNGTAKIGCSFLTFNLSNNLMSNDKVPITCNYAEDKTSINDVSTFCWDCKKFTLNCWKEKYIRNDNKNEAKLGEYAKAGIEISNASNRGFTNIFGTSWLLIILFTLVKFI